MPLKTVKSLHQILFRFLYALGSDDENMNPSLRKRTDRKLPWLHGTASPSWKNAVDF